jgi:uncharacterized membrane protein
MSGMIVCMFNQLRLGDAMLRSLSFGILVAVIVSILAWASEAAEQKGYPSWLGFWLAVILNVFGILIIWLLPDQDNKLTLRNQSDNNNTD